MSSAYSSSLICVGDSSEVNSALDATGTGTDGASSAALGSLGNEEDKELLEGLRAGLDQQIYKAIDAAIKKLKAKETPEKP